MTKPSKKLKIALTILGVLGGLLLAVALFMKSPLFEVSLSTTESHLEIGSALTTDPAYYLEGDEWCVNFSIVDTSNVKYTKVGRYPVYIYHGFKKYTSYVNVTDTTAPVISCDVKNKTVEPGDIVSVNSLGLDIQDYSEIESILFTKISSSKFYTGLPDEDTVEMRAAYQKGLDMEAEEFQFAYGGIYTLTITVSDAFHNSSEITLTLTVEEPPVIEVPADFYVAATNEIDFTEYINVWDFISDDLDADDVEVDTSELNMAKTGDYTVTFSATDDYGLTSSASSTVHISSQNDLQNLINTHAINLNDHIIIGAYNAYDSGYYETEDIAYIQDIMLPSIVSIENDAVESLGSGFIIEITDEFVTIATNAHVVTDDLTVDLTFFDVTSCSGAVVASNEEKDIAFIRIPIDGGNRKTSLSSDYVSTLRTVHIDKAYWDGLANDCGITIGYTCINNEGAIWATSSGNMVEKNAVRTWNTYEDINEMIISMDPISGSSGSAIFDGYGRLMGMIRGYTEYAGYSETVAVPLDEILKYFELVFKYKVQYQ